MSMRGNGAAPAAATTRRLMKEWQAVLESGIGANHSGADDSFSSSASVHSSAGSESAASSAGSAAGKKHRGSSARDAPEKKAKAQEDLLELRPWDADGEDLYEWYARIRGPPDGSYAGGEFELSITVPPTYPVKPPTMTFRTRIWHPNVHFKTGEICLDLLSTAWSPAWTLASLCTAVVALLDAPEPSSPLNVDAANVLRSGDDVAYRAMCRMYTQLFAAPRAIHDR